ncbi:hypothetical protein [Solimonas flava]|uniref:hypothetical protein n=1 Tax=Solimonas flava TaxID=415849 RepID=UPI0003FEB720|nr:hypothetical protein [Solimonas flava]
MHIEEQPSSGAVIRTSVIIGDRRIVLCIDADDDTLHTFTMDLEQAVTLIAQLEAAYCCQYVIA